MPDHKAIAIFAQSGTVSAYLTEIVTAAGFQIASSLPDAVLVLVSGAKPKNISQPILWLGGDEALAEEGVRVFKAPLRAAKIIEAIHRTIEAQALLPARMEIGAQVIDTRENLWLRTGFEPIRLTEKEIAILVLLKESAPSMVPRQILLDKVWAYADGVETHTLETHIYRLRQKIEEDPSNPQILLTAEDGYTLAG